MSTLDKLTPGMRRRLRECIDTLPPETAAQCERMADTMGISSESAFVYSIAAFVLNQPSVDKLKIARESGFFDAATDAEIEQSISILKRWIADELEPIRRRSKRKPRISDN
jgi:hypothetical protein